MDAVARLASAISSPCATCINSPTGASASTLGIRIGTAKSRIARARGNLRALLTPFYTAMTRLPLCSDPPWFDTLRPGGLMQRARG
jgi:hypothetical protein